MNKFFEVENDFVSPEVINEPTSRKSIKSVGLFDHVKAITEKSYDPEYLENLSESDRKTFSVYMINRYLSMHPYDDSWIVLINEFQKISYEMPISAVYKLYANVFPKQRVFLKYINGKKLSKYNTELIEIFVKYFNCSKKEAFEYIDIIIKKPDGIDTISHICEKFAKKPDEIKKLLKVR